MSAAKSPFLAQKRHNINVKFDAIEWRIDADIAANPGLEVLENVPAEDSTEDAALTDIEIATMKKFLGELTEQQRELIEHYFSGGSLGEWAQEHGMAYNTAKSLIDRGLMKVGARMGKHERE